MRKLVYGLNVSVDGYIAATGDDLDWSSPSDELFEWWLNIAFAQNWRDTSKTVFSSTLQQVGWNASLCTGDAVAEITRLKAGEGKPMRVGGAALAATAMRAGLIDEYTLVTHPVLLGGGFPS